MRRDLERRLRAAEIVRAQAKTGEVWIKQSNGLLRGARGERLTREEFEKACSGVTAVVVLPDNCRDVVGRGVLNEERERRYPEAKPEGSRSQGRER